jgi:glutathionylspermidine synthase
MLNPIKKLNRSYLNHLAAREETTLEQLEFLNRFLTDNHCTFRGEPMPLLLKPNFLSKRQYHAVSYAVEIISSALTKFIHLYLNDPDVQDIMKFSDKENYLFSFDPGYTNPLVISRLDAFLQDYSIRFLEFNCDSPAGTAYSDVMEKGFSKLFGEYPFMKKWEIIYMYRQELLLEALLQCYHEFRANNPSFPERPVIAIVDWVDVSTSSEFLILQDFFEKRGLKTVVGSPVNFSISGGNAYMGDQEVHLVYKRVITRELLDRWEEVQEFIRCIAENRVCCCNSFQSYIVGNKKILAMITDPRFQHVFNRKELAIIKQTIPWTKILSDSKVKYRSGTVHLRDFILKSKNSLVLKPANLYGGKDVHLGPETDHETWEGIMNEHLHDESWIVQEYVEIPSDIYPVIDNGVRLEWKKVNLNPFALLGKYSGSITRVSDNSVINVSAGGGLVPTMRIKRRK